MFLQCMRVDMQTVLMRLSYPLFFSSFISLCVVHPSPFGFLTLDCLSTAEQSRVPRLSMSSRFLARGHNSRYSWPLRISEASQPIVTGPGGPTNTTLLNHLRWIPIQPRCRFKMTLLTVFGPFLCMKTDCFLPFKMYHAWICSNTFNLYTMKNVILTNCSTTCLYTT